MQRIIVCTFLCFLFFPTVSLGQKSLVIFSGDLRGEIKPCGCAEEGDMGGLPRRLTYFKQQLSQISNLLYFDLGNNFPEPSEQGNLKIQLIQTALKKLVPQVVLVGPNEWLNGLQSLDPKIPYLLSNQSGNLHYLSSKTIKLEKQGITVFGYLSPNFVYQNQNDPPIVLPVGPELLADWKVKINKNAGLFRILLFRGNVEELEKFNQSGLFDLIVTGSSNDDELKQVLQVQTGSDSFPMIPTKGQGLLTGKLTKEGKLIPDNQEIVTADLSVTWLRQNFEDAPELEGTFRTYDAAVKDLFFSNLDRMEQQQQESPFVGNAVCVGCHPNAAEIWKNSRHAHAFATLENNGKHFDPECLECHVVGLKPWEAPADASETVLKFSGGTGFLSSQLTPHLKNVQCENCHGPARAHLENSKIHPGNKEPKSACVICHQGSHSPMFNFETYWPKIRH